MVLKWIPSRNLESSTWRVEINGFGTLEGETYEDTYPEVVKFLGVPYAETPQIRIYLANELLDIIEIIQKYHGKCILKDVSKDPTKRFKHSKMKTDLGFFEAKSFRFGPLWIQNLPKYNLI